MADTEPMPYAENDRHHDHAEGSPECWDKCGDPDTDPTRPADYVAAMTLARTTGRNEFGTPVDHKVCPSCGFEFTVCPPSETFGDHCLGPTCESYDIERDVDYLMALGLELRRDDDA